MARRGRLPRWFAQADRRGTPVRAMLAATIIATLLLVANATRGLTDLFSFLALLSTSATLWLYLACALAALKLGVARPAAAIGLIFSLLALWGAGWDTSLLSLALMAAGLPLYWLARRGRAIDDAACPDGALEAS